MKKAAVFLIIFSVMLWGATGISTNNGSTNTLKTIRVGYCQGEEYYEFDHALNYLILALAERNLIGPLSKDALSPYATSRETWEMLSRYNQSDWIVQFSPKAYFSLTDSEYAELSEEAAAEIMLEVVREEDIDLIVVCGTFGALTALNLSDECGVISLAAADPLRSQIVYAEETSQRENVWALVDTNAFNRSIMVMNDILKPKTLGVVYANNDDAYIYSGVHDLDEFSEENGITVVKRYVDDPQSADSDEDLQRYYREMTAAYEQLAEEGIDVFIMTTSLLEMEDLKTFLEPFYEKNIPVFSINDTNEVKYGALMAVEISDYKNIGRFTADTISAYLKGKALSGLSQVYQTAPFLVINYDTIKRIGYKPDFQMLLVASEIYTEQPSADE